MNIQESHSHLAWATKSCATVILIATGVLLSACTGMGSNDKDAGTTESSQPPETSPSDALDTSCDERTGPPANDKISVHKKSLKIADGEMDFEFYLKHKSELNAVNVDFQPGFTIDGEDVTDQLEDKYVDRWKGPRSVVKRGDNFYGDIGVPVPSDWKDGKVKLEVTVGEPAYWCTPKEDEDP